MSAEPFLSHLHDSPDARARPSDWFLQAAAADQVTGGLSGLSPSGGGVQYHSEKHFVIFLSS